MLERYIEIENPMLCAAAFKMEGLGIALVESMQTRDPHAITGLPLIHLTKILAAIGYGVI
jgi:septum formation protein